ncbi:hypothetical protein PsorP6_014184 [Peronosclerospora sorghi]|uniref:Uncharacterized protein n=1 Tax=Peronosclerospora sorghi TaxID=230839 RepID=A0ACC0VHK6_9STRA|nr:hypothetical protein PsorP6_014184 [Peronosclerospora sorghi]
MNGLNEPNLAMYERLLSSHQLVAFQETKFNKYDSLQSNEHFIHSADSGARCFWSDSTCPDFKERHGVGLVLSSASPFGEVEDLTAGVYAEQLRNRYLLLKTSLGDKPVFLHVVYAPDEPSRRGDFFRTLPVTFNYTDTNSADLDGGIMHIVLGDFNVTMDPYLDQASPSQHLPGQGRAELSDWLDSLGLVDAWRYSNPDMRDYTSPTRKNRLDYCFLTVNLIQDHLNTICHIRDRKWRCEDHIPVEFSLQAKILPRLKRAPWRCPPWLLQVPEIQDFLVTSVHALADRIKLFPGSNPGCLLDEHKRTDSIYLRRRWIELRDLDSRRMASKITAVNSALDLYNSMPTEATKLQYDQAKADLNAYRETIKQRNEAKKFAADLHLSERATSHFFRAPQQDCLRSPITELTREDGTITSDYAEVADGHRRYWGTLFQSTSPDLLHLRQATYKPLKLATLLQDTVPRLTQKQQAMLDSPITANDLYWAIMKSKNGKAPGPDGLPIEYYKLAPHLWARIYEVVHAYQLKKGKMTKFQRRAHISLLYKAGDRSLPGNYRPLTLLNHDAKLGPKVMAWRLGTVLPPIIHEDQKGFVPGRSIRHLLLQFQDLQDICIIRYPDACAVLIDFAKAFDSVLWSALDMVLHHFGFGRTFRAWIKTFYNETSVRLLLNQSPGDPFLLGAGVRQGDPLSPGLFVVFIEPMMNFLRARFSPHGLAVNSTCLPHLVLAFADDCTGMLADVNDAEDFLSLVQEYADAAGLVLNKKKTCIMPFTHHVSPNKLNSLRASTELHVLRIGDTTNLLGVLQDTTGDTATAGKFDKGWIYTPVLEGGLGLTPAKVFIQAMHLKCLRDGIAATNARCVPPRWLSPALELFTRALGPLGVGFDILYATMKGNQWSCLPSFWKTTLRQWADLHTSYGTTQWKPFVQDILLELIDVTAFVRPASRTRLINDTMARFNLILPQHDPLHGPMRSSLVESACHAWSLDGMLVVDMANRHFDHLLLKARRTSSSVQLPLHQLQVHNFHPTQDMWRMELAWDRHVLPICSDVKYRLQHNAMGFLYKFQWRTQVSLSSACVHGCASIETASHLFWFCHVARDVWNYFLPPFAELIDGDFKWQHVLFPSTICVRPTTTQVYGDYAFRVVFNIVRCCVLRALWLHRNKRLYNSDIATSSPFVLHQAKAYVLIHLRQLQDAELQQGHGKRVAFIKKIWGCFRTLPPPNSTIASFSAATYTATATSLSTTTSTYTSISRGESSSSSPSSVSFSCSRRSNGLAAQGSGS